VNKTMAMLPVYLTVMFLWLVGQGSLCTGEEVIILEKHKTTSLAEWDKPVLFGKGHWEVVEDSGEQVIKLRTESPRSL